MCRGRAEPPVTGRAWPPVVGRRQPLTGRGGPGHLWAGASEATRGQEASQATRHFDEVQDPPWTGGGRVWRPAIGCVRFRTAVMDILFAMVTQLTLRDDNPFSLAVDVRRREHLTQVWLTSGFALGNGNDRNIVH